MPNWRLVNILAFYMVFIVFQLDYFKESLSNTKSANIMNGQYCDTLCIIPIVTYHINQYNINTKLKNTNFPYDINLWPLNTFSSTGPFKWMHTTHTETNGDLSICAIFGCWSGFVYGRQLRGVVSPSVSMSAPVSVFCTCVCYFKLHLTAILCLLSDGFCLIGREYSCY